MNVTRKLLSELRRPERNVRMHTDKQLKEFRRSIEMFGQIRPIVVDEDGVILAGTGLYETLLSMGRTEADCYIVTGLTEAQKKKLMLADNRVFDLGVDDLSALDAFVLELKDDLDIPGARERTEAREEAAARNAEEYVPPAAGTQPQEEGPARRFILCPKCGERIWL